MSLPPRLPLRRRTIKTVRLRSECVKKGSLPMQNLALIKIYGKNNLFFQGT